MRPKSAGRKVQGSTIAGKEIGERLQLAIDLRGLGRREVGESLEPAVSEDTVRGWVIGRVKLSNKPLRIAELSELLRVNKAWLADGTGPMAISGEEPETRLVLVPVATTIRGNVPTLSSTTHRIRIPASEGSGVRFGKRLRGHEGGSVLRHSDIPIFEVTEDPQIGLVVLAFHNGEDVIGKLERQGTDLMLQPWSEPSAQLIIQRSEITGVFVAVRREGSGGTEIYIHNPHGLIPGENFE